jgi:hypothetical protein
MASMWTVTVRDGPQVKRMRFETVHEAMKAVQQQLDELAPAATRDDVEIYKRRIDAASQVAARVEVAGPGGWIVGSVHGGIDLRGDGSTEAFIGRIRRSLVELRDGESACQGLRRVLASPGAS